MINVDKGTNIDTPATLADLMPTLLDMVDVDIPDTVDGISLKSALNGDKIERECIHIEYKGNIHALTDGKEKYIWHSQSGAEQLFNLVDDPHELNDISQSRGNERCLESWRKCLAARLKGRPEGFSDGEKLFTGRPTQAVLSHAGPKSEAKREKFFT